MNYYISRETACISRDNKQRSTPHILGRRFALTSTAYKYLDIRIVVGPVSAVEIILGDTRGNALLLPHSTWTTLIQKREDIEQHVQSAPSPTSLTICDLVLTVVTMRGMNLVQMKLYDACMYMKPSTLLFLFELEQCVEHAYSWLCQNTHYVSEKYKQFVTILKRNSIAHKHEAVKILREYYDKNSPADCELLTFAVDNMLYDAINN
ncbi:uncharacterized protein LOC122400643 [Colletes gigas]|uniref:uncharacterized protein LOC122400643 n=1 Tax=Colletes gigas TaxID=935657 RepID=UPI001C9AFE2A|nr:uncharacterized protein LOC122400643 [Colletes gigas]